MLDTLIWWVLVTLLGLIAWPALFRWLPGLPDRGYTLARAGGLLVFGYLVWILGTFHLLPNTRPFGVLLLALGGAGAVWLVRRQSAELRQFWQSNQALILAGELLFAGALFLWAFVRAHNPEIVATEKPMDFAFFNSSQRSAFFPPADPWLTPYSISYYYFGYLIFAKVSQLSGVESAVGFNLAISTLFALVAFGIFGLGFNLWRRRRGATTRTAIAVGLTAAFLMVGIGNLQGILSVARARNLGDENFWVSVGVKEAIKPYDSPTGYPQENWWFWPASRVIDTAFVKNAAGQYPRDADGNIKAESRDYTITEFPFFSFLLGDLHPHVLALPFTILALGLALEVALSSSAQAIPWPRRFPQRFVLAAIALGGLGFMNSWDFPTYMLIFLGAVAFRLYAQEGRWRWDLLAKWMGFAIALGASAILLFFPFYLTFQSQVRGIAAWQGPGTQWQHLVIFWGPLLFLVVSFLATQLWQKGRSKGWPQPFNLDLLLLALMLALTPLMLWVLRRYVIMPDNPPPKASTALALAGWWDRLSSSLPEILLFVVGLVVLFRWVLRPFQAVESDPSPEHVPAERSAHVFVLMLIVVGALLILGTEHFYIVDVFDDRMNTMFKFYYQAWTLFAIAGAYGFHHVLALVRSGSTVRRPAGLVWAGVAGLLVAAAFVYPLGTTPNKANSFQQPGNLDGLAFTQIGARGDAEAIRWLSQTIPDQPVIAEASGGSYSEYGRVSERTGFPTILGWPGHESQWRGSDKPFAGRDQDVDAVFGTDAGNAVRLLAQYQVGYVYYGSLERAKYPNPWFRGDASSLEVVYDRDNVTIYRVKPEAVAKQAR